MKGGDGCEEGIEKRSCGKGSNLLVGYQRDSCQIDNEKMSQVKELKGLSPGVAGLQHLQRQADRALSCLPDSP
jgi:hypothetical protein